VGNCSLVGVMKVLVTMTGVAIERICLVLKNWYSECTSNLWFQYGSLLHMILC